MSKPNPKGPTQTISIYCSSCRYLLLKYRKGGKGALVKCFIERITQDNTSEPGICPSCDQSFARATMIRGVPSLKIIGKKVYFK
ncbi:hypothetical protein [Alteromonas sp. V450]|uniref:hypothetical protein n=1 Tax=Alteromonas sp. V450 TaxID=1912139 RepID=UPI0008FF2888|nr:hypothetical protein [Alteromonas sp. V450]